MKIFQLIFKSTTIYLHKLDLKQKSQNLVATKCWFTLLTSHKLIGIIDWTGMELGPTELFTVDGDIKYLLLVNGTIALHKTDHQCLTIIVTFHKLFGKFTNLTKSLKEK